MKFFNFIRRHPFIAVFILTVVAIAGIIIYQVYFGNSIDQVQTNQAQSQTHVTEAVTSEKQAANFEVERGIEDGIREQVITPKLEAARRRSAESADTLKKARTKYENEKTNTSNLSNSHLGDCRDLSELFPNIRFSDCAGAK